MNEFKGRGIFSISLKTRANGFLPTLVFALYDTLISLNPNEHKKKQCLSREQINSMTYYQQVRPTTTSRRI